LLDSFEEVGLDINFLNHLYPDAQAKLLE